MRKSAQGRGGGGGASAVYLRRAFTLFSDIGQYQFDEINWRGSPISIVPPHLSKPNEWNDCYKNDALTTVIAGQVYDAL